MTTASAQEKNAAVQSQIELNKIYGKRLVAIAWLIEIVAAIRSFHGYLWWVSCI